MKRSLFLILGTSLLLGACAGTHKKERVDQDLIQASREGKVPQVVALIRQGADINAVDPEGWTPYLAASAEGNWKVMKLLQEMGAKTDPGF
jgi:ankyrin repeat protein